MLGLSDLELHMLSKTRSVDLAEDTKTHGRTVHAHQNEPNFH
jgi:hypothetical protein